MADGIVAACTISSIPADQLPPGTLGAAGDGRMVSIAQSAEELFKHTDEDALRIVVGDHTVNAVRRRDGDDTTIVAIAIVTGHPIVKSLARILRKVLRDATRTGPVPAESVPSAAPKISFHTAWGQAKERADYHKEDWGRAQRVHESEAHTLADWLELVKAAPGQRKPWERS